MKILLLSLALMTAFSCKKENRPEITATVLTSSGFPGGGYIIVLDSPDPKQHSFICEPPSPTSSFMCMNSANVLNLPSNLAVIGKKIKFTRFKDLGRNIVFSSTYVASDIEIYDAREN